MIKVNKPINLKQLDQELNGKGLLGTLDDEGNHIEVALAESNDATLEELQAAIDAHVAIDPKAEQIAAEEQARLEAEAKAATKAAALAKLGLTEEEINAFLA